MGRISIRLGCEPPQFFPFDKPEKAVPGRLKHFTRLNQNTYCRLYTSPAKFFVHFAVVIVLIGAGMLFFMDPSPSERYALIIVSALMASVYLALAGFAYVFLCPKIILNTERKTALLGRGPWMLRRREILFSRLLGLEWFQSGIKGFSVYPVSLLYRVSASKNKRYKLGGLRLEHAQEFFREFCRILDAAE